RLSACVPCTTLFRSSVSVAETAETTPRRVAELGVKSADDPRWTTYPVTPVSSLAGDQATVTVLPDTAARSPVGVVGAVVSAPPRSEEHTSELQSRFD